MVYAVSEVRRMKFRIGELADKCGVNKETIRYYERLGLIPEPERTEKDTECIPNKRSIDCIS